MSNRSVASGMVTPNIEVNAEKVAFLERLASLSVASDALLLDLKGDMRCNQRWVYIASTQLQQGFMALERAVVRLDKDRL